MRTGAQYRKPCITDARSGSLNIARLAPEDRGDRLRGQRTPQRLGRRCLHPAAGSGTRRNIEAAADPQFLRDAEHYFQPEGAELFPNVLMMAMHLCGTFDLMAKYGFRGVIGGGSEEGGAVERHMLGFQTAYASDLSRCFLTLRFKTRSLHPNENHDVIEGPNRPAR